MLYNYTTSRLELKILGEEDAALTAKFFSKNQKHFQAWEMEYSPDYYTEEYQRRTLAAEFIQYLHSHAVRYYFFLSGKDLPIGTAAFSHIERSPLACCRLGYRLDKDFVGCGYMTEALRFLIPKIFFFYQLHRMEANVLPENIRSLRLLERLGFTPEGTVRGICATHCLRGRYFSDSYDNSIHSPGYDLSFGNTTSMYQYPKSPCCNAFFRTGQKSENPNNCAICCSFG